MELFVAWIQAKPGKDKFPAIKSLTAEYLKRLSHYSSVEGRELPDEAALFKRSQKSSSRVAPFLVLLDSRGTQFSSEELAQFIRSHQDRGTQQMLFAIGGADGFSPAALAAASQCLSLGRMTFPHELARVILLEQLYRAFTILKGHPYHCGH